MIAVLCPSKGRPDKAREAFDSFIATKSSGSTVMLFVIDADDETGPAYKLAGLPVIVAQPHTGGMGPPLNAGAVVMSSRADVIGFIGDDHRFRTKGWDQRVIEELRLGGIAYGNDLGRPDLPTQVFISSPIVRALGWMALPGAHHLYLDNTWAELGRRAGCLHYMEDVVIEHMHPVYGKGESDAGYQRVNHPSIYGHDGRLYTKWLESGQVDIDVKTVKGALG